MVKLTREDLWSLEQYAQERTHFRRQVMQHKKVRQLPLGDHARLYFEDETTIRYQIQEMLRAEKVFEPDGIQEELDAYNPLIPDGCNWKATFMLEYEDERERALKTRELRGIEKAIYVQVEGFGKVYPIANEDLERDDGEKTSTVHFLRFEFSPAEIAALKHGAKAYAAIEHAGYTIDPISIDAPIRDSLVSDLAEVQTH